MSQTSSNPPAVRVSAPARLHLGFLDLDGALGRRFGSIGLALDQPATTLTVRAGSATRADGPERDRVISLLERFTVQGARGTYAVKVESAIPAHAGLGSGTQLALALGVAIARLEARDLSPRELAEIGERGARSGIGLGAFTRGGFLVDGGRGPLDTAPPLTVCCDFPDAWRVLLILDSAAQGVSGEEEKRAFSRLAVFPEHAAAHICHLVLMKLLPGLKEADIEPFGHAITEIQQIVGGHFAATQGGSSWSSPAVGRLAQQMRELGATGIGQSSWGPTGFAFVRDEQTAARLYHSLVEQAKADRLEILICRGRNRAAAIGPA